VELSPKLIFIVGCTKRNEAKQFQRRHKTGLTPAPFVALTHNQNPFRLWSRWNAMGCRQRHELLAPVGKERVTADEERVGMQARKSDLDCWQHL
jgi:hypothetical protein